jgi:8-oxo-dGTP diphosphatase
VKRRVSEGKLSWQFPAGAIEEGESPEEAAVREAREETDLSVKASKNLGHRVHPATGRTMYYVACDVVAGNARVSDDEELEDFTWATLGQLPDYIPYGLFDPVQQHLDSDLSP